MKKSTILITLVSFLFMGISSIAQISEHKKLRDNLKPTKRTSPQTIDKKSLLQNFKSSDGQVSRPGNSEDYYWESGSNTWFHATNTEYSYNESGQILERLTTEANSGTNLWKDVYTYDSHGEMTENTSYIWNGTEWEISYGNKYNITYDNNGNITENEYQWWDYQTNSWQNEWKDISVYDNNGYITEMIYQNWENEAWLNNWKDVLTLNASGIPTELMNYEWDGNDWVASEKYTDIVWHSWLGWDENGSQPSSYTNQTYENGQWVNYERYNAIYTGNNYIGTYEVWENGAWMNSDRETVIRSATERSELYEYWDNGAWVIESKDTETFDDHGNSTGYKYEYWENGAWVIQYAMGMTHTYNEDGDITETIFSQWDYESMSMVNYERKVYSNFYHFESAINNTNSLANVSIYPNPVVSLINIQIDDNDVNSYQVEIINITGQKVFTNSYSNLSTSVNVENLNSGIYFIRITADNKKIYNYKLMKE